MITQAQDGTRKPMGYFSSCHPIPTCFLANLVAHSKEPKTFQQAFKESYWCKAMQEEIDALHANHS